MANETIKVGLPVVRVTLLIDTAYEHPAGGHIDAKKGETVAATPQSALRLIELGKALAAK